MVNIVKVDRRLRPVQHDRRLRPAGLVARWIPAPDGRGLVCRWVADSGEWFAPVTVSARRPPAPARPRRLMPRLLARAA